MYNDDLEEDNSDWEEGEGGEDDEDEDSDIEEADGEANESTASVNANDKDGEKGEGMNWTFLSVFKNHSNFYYFNFRRVASQGQEKKA